MLSNSMYNKVSYSHILPHPHFTRLSLTAKSQCLQNSSSSSPRNTQLLWIEPITSSLYSASGLHISPSPLRPSLFFLFLPCLSSLSPPPSNPTWDLPIEDLGSAAWRKFRDFLGLCRSRQCRAVSTRAAGFAPASTYNQKTYVLVIYSIRRYCPLASIYNRS